MALPRRVHDESGVILAITAILLTVLIGFAALAIDVGSFYQAQRQAQAAADAGALAGADDLAATSATTVATNDAKTMAAENYGGINSPTSTVSNTATSVTVTVAGSTPSFFGQIFGLLQANVSARAVASVNSSSSNCSVSGNCYAMFAMDSSCGDNGLTLHGNLTINGALHSNGSISFGSNDVLGNTTYGNGPGCTATPQNDTISGGPTPEAPVTSWPIPYNQSPYFPACGGTSSVSCTGPNDCPTTTTCAATPSYCSNLYSQAGVSFSSSSTPAAGVDCFPGTGAGVNPKDPSTWTGAVSVGSGGFQANQANSDGVTYICGEWDGGTGGVTLGPATGQTLLMYAADSNGITLGTGNGTYVGDIFAPGGPITLGDGNNSTNFIEGQTVNVKTGNLTITGDGPTVTNGGGSIIGTASLVQ